MFKYHFAIYVFQRDALIINHELTLKQEQSLFLLQGYRIYHVGDEQPWSSISLTPVLLCHLHHLRI